jgi:segregation and condensation protein A
MTAEPATPAAEARRSGFEVRLANFSGPFDLLLGLISKHQLDITEVALATVTDEFIRYIRNLQELGRSGPLTRPVSSSSSRLRCWT